MTETPTTVRHASGQDKDGCVACYFEAVEAVLNGDPSVPGCFDPKDDGDGFCHLCGHVVEVAP